MMRQQKNNSTICPDRLRYLKKQIAANNTQKASVAAELSVFESKKATLNEQVFAAVVKKSAERNSD